MAELPVSVGSVLDGRYRVDGLIGAGSMGVVAAGFNLDLHQPVAIKFLLSAGLGTKEALGRFRREVRTAAKIRSEHVARVLDVGTLDSGLPYMVMEFLEGRNLEDELTELGTVPVVDAVSYVLQAIEALAEAHAASVVHRDLKPANLFLARRADNSPIVKVLDFGIAKTFGEGAHVAEIGLTRTGTVVGSPLYMSPEQLRSTKIIDCRADIWALGAILFQLVTAQTPYQAQSVAELYAMLLRDQPAPPSRYRTDLPPGLEAVIMRCLERDPSLRFANVSALADALLPFAPVGAHVHAQRAYGVLFGTSAPFSETHASTPPLLASGSVLPSSGDHAQSFPPATGNGKTTAPWGLEAHPAPRRKRQTLLLAFSVLGVAVGVGLALSLWRHEEVSPPQDVAVDNGPISQVPAAVPQPPASETPPSAPVASASGGPLETASASASPVALAPADSPAAMRPATIEGRKPPKPVGVSHPPTTRPRATDAPPTAGTPQAGATPVSDFGRRK
jgi:eukaryotic-like serine/threonine-protein kinase